MIANSAARVVCALVLAVMAVGLPASSQTTSQTTAQPPARHLVDGRDWKNSSAEERRAYLIGVSNVISVGARYDAKQGDTASFAINAQKRLAGAQLEPAIETITAWYNAHPDMLDKPVLSVVWRELAKPDSVG